MSNCLWPHGLYIPWNSPGQNTGVVAFSFSRGSSKPRDRTHVSWIAGGLFTSWATREDQEYWSLWPIPSPADLFNPGIEPESPALQVDSLPTELLGKPRRQGRWPFYHLFKNFPQFVMIRIVKGFNTVDETEVDFFFFWNSLAFSMIRWMLAIWSLAPLPFLNPAWCLKVLDLYNAEA